MQQDSIAFPTTEIAAPGAGVKAVECLAERLHAAFCRPRQEDTKDWTIPMGGEGELLGGLHRSEASHTQKMRFAFAV